MPLSEQELFQVLEMFQKSGWEAMQLQSGELKLSISKSGRLLPASHQQPERPAAAPTAVANPASAAIPTAATASDVDPRWVPVKAPMLGHFYAAPKPGALPFVTLGQQVAADDTVAILEVMKLMNHVKAGIAGRVAGIAVANGELVEFEQALLYIDPAP